jgi:hypothetical protein
MRLLLALAVAAGTAAVAATPAAADTVRNCAELTDPQSPNFDTNRDTWWRYTDERGMSCAEGDLSAADDGLGASDDEDDDTGSAPKADGARGKEAKL